MVQLPPDSFLCVNVVKQRVIYCSINETRILRAFGAHHRDSRHIIAQTCCGFCASTTHDRFGRLRVSLFHEKKSHHPDRLLMM